MLALGRNLNLVFSPCPITCPISTNFIPELSNEVDKEELTGEVAILFSVTAAVSRYSPHLS